MSLAWLGAEPAGTPLEERALKRTDSGQLARVLPRDPGEATTSLCLRVLICKVGVTAAPPRGLMVDSTWSNTWSP